VDEAAAVRLARADRSRGDLVAGADDAPERRVEALARQLGLRPRLEVARHVAPGIRERLLVGGVELAGVALRVERDDAQPIRPVRRGRRPLELDAHLAEDPHGDVAERLEQLTRVGVGLQDGVLDFRDSGAGRFLLELGRD
jgi:hypothetical protein